MTNFRPLIFISALAFSVVSFADVYNLSEPALLNRCYSQITSQQLSPSDPLAKSVAAGQMKAVDACMQVFNSAQLSGSPVMSLKDVNDARAVSVLATFHRIHSSWFMSRDFPTHGLPGQSTDMKDIYDSSSPAFYFTRALFGSGISASDPLTTRDFLAAVRATMAPVTGPESGHPLADFIFDTSFHFAPVGRMTGIEKTGDTNIAYVATPGTMNAAGGTINLTDNQGGGFLGTQTYVDLNLAPINHRNPYKTDGAAQLPRRLGKAIYHDVLCRDLPVIREVDALPFVDAQSPTAFRTASTCVQCHASHDRISMVARNMHISYLGGGDPSGFNLKRRGGNFVVYWPVTKPAESSWPSSADADFYQRPPTSTIYYRDYNGNLVNQTVVGFDALGNALAATDDYYACLAKRYYRYFTGIDVNLGDLSDPTRKVALSTVDAAHRAQVIELGKNLKQSQSVPQLIKAIISLPSYKQSDFGTRGIHGS